MRYILSLLFISLISTSTSIIANSTKEINKVVKNNSLQSNCSTFIRKNIMIYFHLLKKVQYYFWEGKIIQLSMMADIIIKNITDEDKQIIKEGSKLIDQSKKSEIKEFDDLIEKYKIKENPIKYERITTINNIRNDIFKNEVCRRDYEIVRATYKQINKYYYEIKRYYEQIKNIYTKYSMQKEYKRILEAHL